MEWFYRWDVPACEREYQKALELNPNDPTAHFGMAMFQASMRQDHERAAVEAHLALSLDPLSILVRSMLCWTSYWSRSYDQAIDQARKTLELEVDAPQACYVLGAAARAKGALTDAIAVLENAAARFADPLSVAYLGMAYALAGRRDEAQSSLQRLKGGYGPHGVPSIFFAFVYTGLADHQVALDHLDRAFDEHDAFVLWLPVSPDWDLLRGETRFKQLLTRLRSAVQLAAPA